MKKIHEQHTYLLLIMLLTQLLVITLLFSILFNVINVSATETEISEIEIEEIIPEETLEVEIIEEVKEPRYKLTDKERELVEKVVTAEACGQSLEGQMLVAQCILNGAEIDKISIGEVITRFGYAKPRDYSTEQVRQAVSLVFDEGQQITEEPILYFYAPKLVYSEFHESQVHVITEGDHKFFKRR